MKRNDYLEMAQEQLDQTDDEYTEDDVRELADALKIEIEECL